MTTDGTAAPTTDPTADREALLGEIRDKAVVHGTVVLSSAGRPTTTSTSAA